MTKYHQTQTGKRGWSSRIWIRQAYARNLKAARDYCFGDYIKYDAQGKIDKTKPKNTLIFTAGLFDANNKFNIWTSIEIGI